MLLRAILCGGAWNGFLLGKAKKEDVPCRFCGKRDGDGHLFWECTFSPPHSFNMLGIFLSLLLLCPSIAAAGLVVYFGMVGCLGFSGRSDKGPWASSFGDSAFGKLERCLGAYPVDLSGSWTPPDYWDADDVALEVTQHPNIWTDGSRRISPLWVVLRLLVLVFMCLPL